MKTKIQLLVAAAVLSLGAGSAAWAAAGHDQHVAVAQAAGTAALTSGEVRKVDAATGKVTIKHEHIANLDMPPMTMVFRAQKPELLKNLKAGDRIRFRAEQEKGALIVTQIEAAK